MYRSIIVAACVLWVPLIADAQYKTPGDKQRAGLAKGTIVDAVTNITGLIASIIGVLAILAIVISGVYYITSGGDSGRIETAKGWLTWGIIGLVVALLAWVAVNAISGALGAG